MASLTLRRARTRRAAGSRSKRGGRTGLARVPQAQTPGPPRGACAVPRGQISASLSTKGGASATYCDGPKSSNAKIGPLNPRGPLSGTCPARGGRRD